MTVSTNPKSRATSVSPPWQMWKFEKGEVENNPNYSAAYFGEFFVAQYQSLELDFNTNVYLVSKSVVSKLSFPIRQPKLIIRGLLTLSISALRRTSKTLHL